MVSLLRFIPFQRLIFCYCLCKATIMDFVPIDIQRWLLSIGFNAKEWTTSIHVSSDFMETDWIDSHTLNAPINLLHQPFFDAIDIGSIIGNNERKVKSKQDWDFVLLLKLCSQRSIVIPYSVKGLKGDESHWDCFYPNTFWMMYH